MNLWWIWRVRCQQVFQPDEPWSNLKVAGLSKYLFNEILSAYQEMVLDLGFSVAQTISLFRQFLDLLQNIYGSALFENADLTCKIQDILHRNWLVKFALINREVNSIADCLAKKEAQCDIDYSLRITPSEELELSFARSPP
ncbi:hypothetical protein PIB30_000553 [Stylosanthes scabra]|uniref:RNase H type-1 domain-containing protein n=1 Tax=Stylosanthes scabra TaxID=79078 RepID=A0ABU6X4J9_9FABA|nr:hypothetical protein [Stylosanthes scabra]